MVSEDMFKAFPLWLEYLGTRLPGGLKSILHLCVSYEYYPRTFFFSLPSSTVVEDMLEKFTGLTTLLVENVYLDFLGEVEQRIRLCLEKNKDNFISQSPPRLTITSRS